MELNIRRWVDLAKLNFDSNRSRPTLGLFLCIRLMTCWNLKAKCHEVFYPHGEIRPSLNLSHPGAVAILPAA